MTHLKLTVFEADIETTTRVLPNGRRSTTIKASSVRLEVEMGPDEPTPAPLPSGASPRRQGLLPAKEYPCDKCGGWRKANVKRAPPATGQPEGCPAGVTGARADGLHNPCSGCGRCTGCGMLRQAKLPAPVAP